MNGVEVADDTKHVIYEGLRPVGGAFQKFGRCSCRAFLESEEEIEQHREETANGEPSGP